MSWVWRFEMWRLERAERKAWSTLETRMKSIVDADSTLAVKPEDLIVELEHYRLAELRVKIYHSRLLVYEAETLDVTIPPDDDGKIWEKDKSYTHPFLTAAGRHQLRTSIDLEKSRRFEVKTLWVTKIILPLAGVLVGIIGALTGLVAVLQHKK
jgi:hypothetical protein